MRIHQPYLRFALTVVCLVWFVIASASCGSNDDEESGNADGTDVNAEPEPEETTSSPLPSDPVDVATAYWEAVEAGDAEAAASLIDPASLESGDGWPPGRAARTLEDRLDWYQSVGLQWTLGECEAGDGGTVECTASAGNEWSEALGVEPVTGSFLLQFSEDGITQITDPTDSFGSRWGPMVFVVFAEWVDANHPEDAQVMFNFEVDVNAEILSLYEVNTQRFVEAQQSG